MLVSEAETSINAAQKRVDRRGGDVTRDEERQLDDLFSQIDSLDERMAEIDEHHRREQELEAARPAWFRHIHNTTAGAHPMNEHRAGQWLANELRALVGSGTTEGGAYTPAGASKEFFDLLAAESVALRSGMNQIRTDRDSLVIPRLTGDVGASWVAEAAAIPQTSLTADQVTATPRKLGALEQLSNEVIEDSDPAILDVVGRSIVRSLGLKLDLGVFEGSGTPPEIRGLKNVSGIGTVTLGTNGGALANLDVSLTLSRPCSRLAAILPPSSCTLGRGVLSSSLRNRRPVTTNRSSR